MNNKVNIKDYLNEDIFTILNSFVSKMENRLVRNIYVGTVVEHDEYDEENAAIAGKCKIMVYGVYDNIPVEHLPWALPDKSWMGSQTGSFIVPPVGTLVRVEFDSDNIYRPIYSAKILQKDKVSPLIDKHYPNNMLMWSTDAGSSLQHDRTTGEEIKTNMIGEYKPETVDVGAIANNDSSLVTVDAAAEYTDDGKIVETINGGGDEGTIEDSFYNKAMTINDDGTAVASREENIKKDGSYSLAHKIEDAGAEITLDINDAGEITIAHTGEAGTDTITINEEGYTITDKFGNTIAMTETGLKILALDGKGLGAGHNYTQTNSNCNPGLATPDPANLGGWCAIPVCPITGAPHVGNMMTVMQPPK